LAMFPPGFFTALSEGFCLVSPCIILLFVE
jgi:hypothetical protein